ncbi:hypothetical protein HY572_00960 [Candidatus Micrarchaeota archaeon]|nr:hypothetical protein [Candidatus Micrarchaeota archaeon]
MQHQSQLEQRVKRLTIQSLSSVAMAASAATQSEVVIPNVGALVALEFHLTQSTTGTLTGANTLDYAIQDVKISDKGGNAIWQNVRGRDLAIIEQLFSPMGINTAVATTSSSSQTRRYYLPNAIAQKDMDARLQVTIAPFSDMATSGATGGTVTLTVVGLYSNVDSGFTQRYMRLSQSIVSGANRFGPNLPQGRRIELVGFTVGTEANVTDFTLSRDGSLELSALTPADLIALDQDRFVSGHITGRFRVPVTPFIPSSQMQLDVTGAGSDTINWYLGIRE